VEVLVAIFVTGVGLLALLTLFPLGALDMARAIKDDRAASVAVEAHALSQNGQELVSRTAEFVRISLSQGSADGDTAALLRSEYEKIAFQAADLEAQLKELQSVLPPKDGQRYVGPLLEQIRAIEMHVNLVVQLLFLF
jgi:hypothetical protein